MKPITGKTPKDHIPPELANAAFRSSEAKGLGLAPLVRRHDASNILCIDGVFHVWYTRYEAEDNYNHREIWLAVSEDGRIWTERGSVFPAKPGAWCNKGRHPRIWFPRTANTISFSHSILA